MKLSSEIETLLLCAQYHRHSSALVDGFFSGAGDHPERVVALANLLQDSEKLLWARLGEVATRAGLLGQDQVTETDTLLTLAERVFDRSVTALARRGSGNVVMLSPENHDAETVRGVLLGDPAALIRKGVRTLLYSIPANESVVLETMYGVHRDGRPVTVPLRRVLGLKQTAEVLGWRRDTTERRYKRALLKLTGSRADMVQHLLPYIDRQQPRSQDEVFLSALYA